MYNQPQPPGYAGQPPGYAGQPPPAPPEMGLYPQPGAVPNYNQPQAGYGGPPPPQQPPPQQNQVYPQPPPYGVATQPAFVQQPGVVVAPVVQPMVTTVQPMVTTVPTSTVIIQQGPRKPENYMVMAILVTFFCNCPLGTLAWVFSCLSDTSHSEGNEGEARSRGRVSMWLSIAGIIITVILIIAIPAALAGGTAAAWSSWDNSYYGKNFWGRWSTYSCRECMNLWTSSWKKENCKQTC